MKIKIIIILMLSVVMFSCVEEITEGCPSRIGLTFTHENSTESFDSKIGSDVHLFAYNDGVLYKNEDIPFSRIEGGKEYVMQNDKAGQINLVAWSSVASTKENIHEGFAKAQLSETSVKLTETTKAGVYDFITGDLYLGQISFDGSSGSSELSGVIDMKDCLSKVSVVINNGSLTGALPTDRVWVAVSGTKSRMDLSMMPAGKDAVVYTDMNYETSEDKYISSVMGLLPSSGDQKLSVTVYQNDKPILRVDTEEKSKPGSKIVIVINLGISAEIFVDGWRVSTAKITDL